MSMVHNRNGLVAAVVTLALLACAPVSHATLVNLGPGSFTPLATVITFDEVPLNTSNPHYSFTGLPTLGNENVDFCGTFVGQTVSGGFPVTLVNHLPSGPLTLNYAGPATFTAPDGASPTSPILSGTPYGNGPISVLFSAPVAAVGLTGGYFDALNSTTIEAYDVNGNSLGSITNSQLGEEFYGLADASGNNVIAGISFYITGNEPAGFGIDNLTFGAKDVLAGTPEPSALALAALGLVGLAAVKFGKRS